MNGGTEGGVKTIDCHVVTEECARASKVKLVKVKVIVMVNVLSKENFLNFLNPLNPLKCVCARVHNTLACFLPRES